MYGIVDEILVLPLFLPGSVLEFKANMHSSCAREKAPDQLV